MIDCIKKNRKGEDLEAKEDDWTKLSWTVGLYYLSYRR
jgi:hypothetical protein